MKIHEYQAKDIFDKYGIPTVKGRVVTSADQAFSLCEEIGAPMILKAQVHRGGRGKAGGVKIAQNPSDARDKAAIILGMNIKECPVNKLLCYNVVDIKSEAYLGVTIDRGAKKIVLLGTCEGGVDIEELAKTNPEAIFKYHVDPGSDVPLSLFKKMGNSIFSNPLLAEKTADILSLLYKIFIDYDCSLIEINPLVLTEQDQLTAIDAKINFDDNALFRHPGLKELQDPEQEDPNEIEARKRGLSFVALQGNIGCIVNGAGLAMATMDLIKAAGGEPANFLDVGGSSNPDKVLYALKIILSNQNVKAIVVNIFGGITRCDDIAKGIISATQSMSIPVPVFVRLTGTNEQQASKILQGTSLITANTLDEVIAKAVERVGSLG